MNQVFTKLSASLRTAEASSPNECASVIARALDTAERVANVHMYVSARSMCLSILCVNFTRTLLTVCRAAQNPTQLLVRFAEDPGLGRASVYHQAAAAYAALPRVSAMRVARLLASHIAAVVRATSATSASSNVPQQRRPWAASGLRGTQEVLDSVLRVVAVLQCGCDLAPVYERLLAHRLIRNRAGALEVGRGAGVFAVVIVVVVVAAVVVARGMPVFLPSTAST